MSDMILFDLDGTLLDSNGIWLDIDIEFLGRHGIAPVPEDYTEYVTHHSPLDAARYTRTRFGLVRRQRRRSGRRGSRWPGRPTPGSWS